jgi:aminoglycoside phosphotransferase (APT) family kinase protein
MTAVNTSAQHHAEQAAEPQRRPSLAEFSVRRVIGVPADSAPLRLSALETGRFNWCWKVDSGEARYLLKLNNTLGIRHLRRLARATRAAATAGVAVPRVLNVGVDHDLGPFLVQQWIEGQTLTELLGDQPGSPGVDPAVWPRLGRQIGLLHQGRGPAPARTAVLGKDLRYRELRRLTARARRTGVLPAATATRVNSRALTLLDSMTDKHPVFSHLDVHSDNVLITSGQQVVLLDFDHARRADPARDFVKIRMWCTPDDKSFQRVRDGYHASRRPEDPSFPAALDFYRLLNHVSYCLYWSTRDPEQINEWIAAIDQELEKQ